MILDTDILIDYFRGQLKTKEYIIQTQEQFTISRATHMELMFGARSKREMQTIHKQLKSLQITLLEINDQISGKAGEFFQSYHHTFGLGIMDAFIAATAYVSGQTLVTQNIKHFRMIKQIDVASIIGIKL